MTKVQFIKTTGGEELAVLPKREYEQLLARAADEDVGTARLVGKARGALASGDEVLLPKAAVDRLAAGENPIRVLREWREMIQAELAVTIGHKQSYLSELETGKRKGPVALHQKIAHALGVPLDFLLPIAVSDVDAEPARFAKRKQAVSGARKARGQR